MSTAAFDTLKFARRLQSVGIPPDQAAGLSEAFAEIMVTELATKSDLVELRLATKSDLAELRLATKSDLAELRGEFRLVCEKLRTEIAASRSEILRWVVPLILAQMALNVGVLLRMGG